MANLKNFFLQLETSIGSGIPLLRALTLISANINEYGLAAKIKRIVTHIEQGSTLSEAMIRVGSPFGQMHTTFIKFGEETGCLDKVCGSLATHAEKEEKLSREIFNSMLYPAFVLLLAVVARPVLKAVISQQPASSATIPAVLNVIIYIALCGGIWALYNFALGGAIDAALVHIPLIGGILKKFALARFTRTLSIGLFAGVPLIQALNTAIQVSGNPWLQNQLKHLPGHVGSGKALAGGLETAGCLPGTLKEMITVGEQSGKLPEMLEKTAAYFEDEAANRINMIMKIFPGLVFLIVALYVGSMLVGAFQSIYSGRFTELF